ncbi:MAG: hypothetical protein ACREE0_22960 [Phenylobacterium sp.]
MVRMTYVGLGAVDAAVREFELLTPHVRDLLALQRECKPLSADHAALGIALDAVETAAFHFTRRRYFYHAVREDEGGRGGGNGRLGDRMEALKAFKALAAYHGALGAMQRRCRPFGRDYLAIEIAKQGLDTAAYHFTREESLYGAKGDGGGATRPVF